MQALVAVIAATVLIPGLVFAQAVGGPPTPAIEDQNSDGLYSLKETQRAFPDVTQADMDKADANGDGKATAAEMMKAVEDGVFKQNK